MKKTSRKLLALVLAAATPGLFAFSCSGVVARETRDAILQGLSVFVEATTIDTLNGATNDGE